MKVREAMSPHPIAVGPQWSLVSAANQLARNRISGAPVIERGQVVGVISETDILRGLVRPGTNKFGSMLEILLRLREEWVDPFHQHAPTVRDVMSSQPILVSPDEDVRGAALRMQERDINRLPVVDDGKLVGIVTRADLVRAIALTGEAIQ
jgi:CBS domain-containing protein